ncbi:diaminopimelate epimerase [Aurantibacter crassamenti]|uniref:diaminopimelate epimerase n=1 Tax=Aurantibacter crassamenti TaxID=1837375 RepID=UPI0019394CCD|nr:diaminopimelate epimerase [Aurantibacter crassamenti]MBM1107525.1 diaminopimelate epimerase [Aurantibacter crassamenti]
MQFQFSKYQGTGNDFIMFDNRDEKFPKNDKQLVARLCDRKFGIGADGLILLENDAALDFKMVYFNADGAEGSMCGNGGRCIVAFAKFLELIENETTFIATDGKHHATIQDSQVSLQMGDVNQIRQKPDYYFLNTGSPHHVQLVSDLDGYNVFAEGKKLRYGLYGQKGSNINFVEQKGDAVFAVRTYERGVEDETLACGTGVTAVVLAMHQSDKLKGNVAKIEVLGGNLEVRFEVENEGYKNIWLIGPAEQVFKGFVEI